MAGWQALAQPQARPGCRGAGSRPAAIGQARRRRSRVGGGGEKRDARRAQGGGEMHRPGIRADGQSGTRGGTASWKKSVRPVRSSPPMICAGSLACRADDDQPCPAATARSLGAKHAFPAGARSRPGPAPRHSAAAGPAFVQRARRGRGWAGARCRQGGAAVPAVRACASWRGWRRQGMRSLWRCRTKADARPGQNTRVLRPEVCRS